MMIFLWLFGMQLDPQVKTRLTQAIQKLQHFKVFFRQETYSDFMDETRAEGFLHIQRPGRLNMTYTKGEQKTIICDGTTCLEQDRMADTQTWTPQQELAGEPLVRFLLYDLEVDEAFLIDRFHRDGNEIFRFRPRDQDDYHVEMTFTDDWLPRSLEILGSDGEGTRFDFENYDLNPSLAPDPFLLPRRQIEPERPSSKNKH